MTSDRAGVRAGGWLGPEQEDVDSKPRKPSVQRVACIPMEAWVSLGMALSQNSP